MEIIHSNATLRRSVRRLKARDKTIVLVPTMGALHAGHEACIELARKHGDTVVVSIFVNPAQFGPGEDFESYPKDMTEDLALCERAGCDVVFAPTVEDMYPETQVVWVEPGDLATPLCGAGRPGHFRGVCTVVCKLFNIAGPDVAVFGQKDAQQALVIRSMVSQLGMGVDIRLCPVVREPDGLACSSRNRYLGSGERVRAARIYEALVRATEAISAGERDPAAVCGEVRSQLEGSVDVEYVELLDTKALRPVTRAADHVILAVAGRIGRTRLIDNVVLRLDASGGVAEAPLF
ncbi:MAG: pantoate--beta-alanine ligase [Candidatus Krumholzibacteriia bacterium]